MSGRRSDVLRSLLLLAGFLILFGDIGWRYLGEGMQGRGEERRALNMIGKKCCLSFI